MERPSSTESLTQDGVAADSRLVPGSLAYTLASLVLNPKSFQSIDSSQWNFFLISGTVQYPYAKRHGRQHRKHITAQWNAGAKHQIPYAQIDYDSGMDVGVELVLNANMRK